MVSASLDAVMRWCCLQGIDGWLAVWHEHMMLYGMFVIAGLKHSLCKTCLHGYL